MSPLSAECSAEPSDQLVALALGSNLGDRLGHLKTSLRRLRESGFRIEALSSIYETPPIGYLDQPPFLNGVVVGWTSLAPLGLLARCRDLEKAAGRDRSVPQGPRTLDVDVVFFKDQIIRVPGLRVPHPRWKERSFVVRPLAAISPYLRDPETGWQVHEVARYWPMEPEEIQIVSSPEALREALEEWKK